LFQCLAVVVKTGELGDSSEVLRCFLGVELLSQVLFRSGQVGIISTVPKFIIKDNNRLTVGFSALAPKLNQVDLLILPYSIFDYLES
jgi:hypothetical protein